MIKKEPLPPLTEMQEGDVLSAFNDFREKMRDVPELHYEWSKAMSLLYEEQIASDYRYMTNEHGNTRPTSRGAHIHPDGIFLISNMGNMLFNLECAIRK